MTCPTHHRTPAATAFRLGPTAGTALILIAILAALPGCGSGGGGSGAGADAPLVTRAFDFQGSGQAVEPGFTPITPADLYDGGTGWGFTTAPDDAIDGTGHAWLIDGRIVTVDDAIPDVVLDAATLDAVTSASGPIAFRVDVPAGSYDLTVWLGDVTSPRYQVRLSVNGQVVDVDRMDISHNRNGFEDAIWGNAKPVVVRASAPDGHLDVVVGMSPGGSSPITWTYLADEDPDNPPMLKTATLVPPFAGVGLQALTLHSARDPPLVEAQGKLSRGSAPKDPGLGSALQLFNAGDLDGALAAFQALDDPALQAARAAGLFWVAGHPAQLEDELALLSQAEALLQGVLAADPDDVAAADLLLQAALARSAEQFRGLLGYASSGAPAAENLGRSCSLVETFGDTHPYGVKGQLLWLRNRGGLDPRRVGVAWERAQWLAQQLDPLYGADNPYVHLYATDQWANDGEPWSALDWATLAGSGPDWARDLVIDLNTWLDLFEWWSIHRQSPEGDLGGGWTDDVEFVPAFALMAYVLEDGSDLSRDAVVAFADGLWNSSVIDPVAGYMAQYGDVEHTAEPTGNILHLQPLMRFGDPQGLERILRSARTFRDLFTAVGAGGERHFLGNHLSATAIALDPDHRADIPLCGRVTAPFPFLHWYSNDPYLEAALKPWAEAWVADAARTDFGKPAGVFPQLVWTPTNELGAPGTGDWWSASPQHGQFQSFPIYQDYLYDLAGWFYLRTGDPAFRQPFDALRDLSLAWLAAGEPALPNSPPAGSEDVWCGGMLAVAMQRSALNLALATGSSDWDPYLQLYAGPYGQFRLDPAKSAPSLGTTADTLRDSWPYRTTEGVMTDRILLSGWSDVISYYLGADAQSVFTGFPVHAVTWEGASRLFAAAVTRTTSSAVEASTYLFSDAGREVTVRFWQLEAGATYRLEVGPADGLGLPPTSVAQTVDFPYDHLGDGARFVLPGRSVYALRVTRTAPGPGGNPLRADVGLGPADITYDAGLEQLGVRVHNVGALDATQVRVDVHAGPDTTGPVIGTQTVSTLPAPVDLVPSSIDLVFAHDGSSPVTVSVDALDALVEITEQNNVSSGWLDGGSPALPAPVLSALVPSTAKPGDTLTLAGQALHPDAEVLLQASETSLLTVTWLDSSQLELQLSEDLPPGTHLVTVRHPDGKSSNPLALTVTP